MNENEAEQLQGRQLAAFTDTLLAGQAMPGTAEASSGRPPLADTVEVLARVFSPQPPPAKLRRKVRRSVAAEWARQRPSLFRRLLPRGRPARRWAWATVAALGLAAITVALLLPDGVTEVAATATGEVGVAVLVAVLVLAGGLAVAWLVSRK